MSDFRIPELCEVEMSFQEAWDVVCRRGAGDCLEGMKSIDRLWSDYCKGPAEDSGFSNDKDFYYYWAYEISAYNIVYESMSKLFAPSEVK